MWSTAAVAIVFLSIARQTRCDDNTFITSGSNAFPSTITQGKDTKIYLRHVGGYIAAVRLSSGADSDDDSDLWIIEPDCPSDSDDSCTAQYNSGSFTFSGSLANGTNIAVGSGYTLELLWTSTQSYDDIDDDTNSVTSPSFSIVSNDGSPSKTGGLSAGAKAGIAVAAVVLVVVVLLYLLWKWRKKSKGKPRYKGVSGRRLKDEEKGEDHVSNHAVNNKQPADTAITTNTTTTEILPLNGQQQQRNKHMSAITPAMGAACTTAAVAVPGALDQQQLYIDDKTELPANEGARHEIDGIGVSAAMNRMELGGVPTIQELPATPLSSHGDTRATAAPTTVFHFTASPSYALQYDSGDATEGVSPVSAGPSGDVSPIAEVARKPVTRKAVGSGSHGSKPVQIDEAQDSNAETPMMDSQETLAREKSALLRNARPRIWKMLGGGGPVSAKTSA